MTFEQWINETNQDYSKQFIERKGQFYFNSLSNVKHNLAMKIIDTEYDPFYNDEKIDLFIGYVYLNWEEGKNETLG